MIISEHNFGQELQRWFSKSVILTDSIDFNDAGVYKSALEIFIYDYKRYFDNATHIDLNGMLSRAELQGIILYRIARIYFLQKNEDVAQKYSLLGRFLSGFEIYYSAEIGKGLKINHGLGTVIGARTVIGENALIHQGITFGDKNGGRPVLRNNVIVYADAKILGNITVENNSIIAANAVCISNVPENSTVAGVPAKIIKTLKK